MAKAVYTVGRFQPPTIGHRMLIDRVISEARRIGGDAYVFVSSVKGTGKDAARNPLDVTQKIELLRNLFPETSGVTFINTATDCLPEFKNCGGPGMALAWLTSKKGYPLKDVTIVLGAERLADPKSKEYFGTGARIWGGADKEPGNFLRVGHRPDRDMSAGADKEEHMSGTKARSYVTSDRKQIADFYTALGYKLGSGEVPIVNTVFDAILQVKSAQKGGVEDEDEEHVATGPDGEPVLGGVRMTRRSKASSRVLYRRGLRSRTGSLRTNRS